MKKRNFIDLGDLSPQELRALLDDAHAMKGDFKSGNKQSCLDGKTLAMVFEKPSTRTRISFDMAMRQLGGGTMALTGSEMQLGQSETIADTARVLSRFVDAIMIRTTHHQRLVEMAEFATIPVINGLTDDTHPCQILADILTYEEHRGAVTGKIFAWMGDGNNVLHSLIEASGLLKFTLRIATPEGREPMQKYVASARAKGANIDLTQDAKAAAMDADCIITDSWISMGQEHRAISKQLFMPYQVNENLMACAKPDALFMHCLPAHRGEEVTDSVIDSKQSVVFDEAENRLHAQKAVLKWCFGDIVSACENRQGFSHDQDERK